MSARKSRDSNASPFFLLFFLFLLAVSVLVNGRVSREWDTSSTRVQHQPRDALVQRALDIIAYFQPRAWYLENPASGLLKTRRLIHGIPSVTVSYCKYGASYKQHTQV